MGNVVQAGLGQNPARQAAICRRPARHRRRPTVNKVCGSGLKAVMLAAQAIRAGDAARDRRRRHGVHDRTRPTCCRNAARAAAWATRQMVDAMIHDGLWDVYND